MIIPPVIQRLRIGLCIVALSTVMTGLPLASQDAGGASRHVQRTKGPPADVAASEPELARLRDRLREIVRRRDIEELASLMGPVIRFDFDEYTPKAFIAMIRSWAGELADDLWCDLRDALELPMARADEYVYAPYVATLHHDLVVVADRVALRAEPAIDAKVIGWLTYGPIDEAPDDTWDMRRPATIDGYEYGWHHVRTPSGTIGWASSKFVRSPMDARLLFERVDGVWKVSAIARGD